MSDRKPSDNQTSSETTMLLMGTFLDTTWRMFVPSVGFTLLGVWADGQFDTKPWFMFAGIVVGFIGAGMLIRKQISNVNSKKGVKK